MRSHLSKRLSLVVLAVVLMPLVLRGDTQGVYTSSNADESGACGAHSGLIHVNYTTGARQYCDGTNWQGITGSGTAWGDITGTLSNQTDLQTALDGKEPAGVAFSDLSGSATDAQIPNTITIDTASTANAGDSATDFFSAGTLNTARLGSGTADSTTFLRGDQTWATPSGGADPWTYLTVNGGADFTTSSATAVEVTGLSFTPSANTKYELHCKLALRTATATVNPRVGFGWSTGLTDGIVAIQEWQAATGAPLAASGNPNAAVLIAVGGLPNTTQSWPSIVDVTVAAGASPSGSTRVQLASETAGTNVTVKSVGSYCRYRSY